MKLLLDTHILLWWLSEDRRLRPEINALLADQFNEVLVSVVSLWEIVVKQRVGKLDVDIGEVVDAKQTGGLNRLDINADHLFALAKLPIHHRDPFDHLLIAQALSEDATFVSADGHAKLYPVRLAAA